MTLHVRCDRLQELGMIGVWDGCDSARCIVHFNVYMYQKAVGMGEIMYSTLVCWYLSFISHLLLFDCTSP